jgi:thiamine-phosphate pyrophosphorylase
MTLDNVRLYVCTDARKDRNDFGAFLNAAFAGGADIIQLRDKTLEPIEELESLEILRDAAVRHGKLWAVNNRADIAAVTEAPVLHIGQEDLPLLAARHVVGKETVIGKSSHTPQQVVDAANAVSAGSLDYFCVGPIWATPSKPGRPAVGLDCVRYAAAHLRTMNRTVPWYAIGGIDHDNIEQVVMAGASRVVVVRAITEADDPMDAARRLRAHLPA